MKIDLSLIRQIMLSIESENFREKINNPNEFIFENNEYYSEKFFEPIQIIAYHLNYLNQGYLIENVNATAVSDGSFIIRCGSRPNLTFAGHDFLNAIREKDVFDGIVKKLISVGGSVTLDIVKSIGVSLLSKKLGL